jgi:hypothetical protein
VIEPPVTKCSETALTVSIECLHRILPVSAITRTSNVVLTAAWRKAEAVAGGPARLQVILVLAGVLGLDTADKAVMSAVAGSLENAFHIGNGQIGLLIDRLLCRRGVQLADWRSCRQDSPHPDPDRCHRSLERGDGDQRLCSFLFMLATRICLGGITAAAFPSIASLVGDFFPARDRACTYGLILTGELIGTGIGFLIGGLISSWIGWRSPFFILAACGLAVGWVGWRFLPEPARGGQDWLSKGQRKLPASGNTSQEGRKHETTGRAQEGVLQEGVEPREKLVLTEDPTDKSLWWAIAYVMHIPTYLLLVAASSLGYFFFGGIRGFAMIYWTKHFGVSRSAFSPVVLVVGIGALAGVVCGGALAEHLLRRGWFATRVVLPGLALVICIAFMAGAIWTTSLAIGIPLLTGGGAALAAANPSYDAARLDLMHPRLWGPRRIRTHGDPRRLRRRGAAAVRDPLGLAWRGRDRT